MFYLQDDVLETMEHPSLTVLCNALTEVEVDKSLGGTTRSLKRMNVPMGSPSGNVAQLISGGDSSGKVPLHGLAKIVAQAGLEMMRVDEAADHMWIRPTL